MSATEASKTAFLPCVDCGGMGFHKRGVFAERSFSTCPACKGLGQVYLAPPKEVKADKA